MLQKTGLNHWQKNQVALRGLGRQRFIFRLRKPENLDWIADGRTKQHLAVLEGGGLFYTGGLRGK